MDTKELLNTEDMEQKLIVEYMGYFPTIKFTHIPNSTYTKSWSVKRRNTALGVRAGFPDLAIIINDKFFCIEMKRKQKSVISEYQKEWIASLKKAHVPVYICYGYDEARAVIDKYLNNEY